jgi:DNA-binding CsgD family transcriptional regulator
VIYVRVFNGSIRPGNTIRLMRTKESYEVQEVGIFAPKAQNEKELTCGQVGYFTCNIKDPRQVHAGETVTLEKRQAAEPLPGYRPVRPLVFCGIYPINPGDFELLRDCIPKLQLSDASFEAQPESSGSFGMGCLFFNLTPESQDDCLQWEDRSGTLLAFDGRLDNRDELIERTAILKNIESLTGRETQVMEQVVEGKANKMIAYNLNVSQRTVEIHRANVMDKMQAKSLAHLVRLVMKANGEVS